MKYKSRIISDGVFGANMTIDTRTYTSPASFYVVCKSCQCACHLCRGRIAPEQNLESLSQKATERALIKLLAT